MKPKPIHPGWMASIVAAGVLAAAITHAPARPRLLDEVMSAYLWSEDRAIVKQAEKALRSDPSLRAMSRLRFHHVEEVIRRGRPVPAVTAAGGEFRLETLKVKLPDGRALAVLVQLPPGYKNVTAWPVILAMHGGPPQREQQALAGARRMINVWKQPAADAGWIIVAPVMTTVVAVGPRTEQRLAYEILRPEQAVAILSAVARRYRVDANRIVSTGISLGSNFSIGFAAAMPDRFAAIVPVSTEGDSREHLLRNLMHVPVYVLEGSRDRNIRGIDGPRALGRILASFGYDITYREFSNRAHEGFQHRYPDVLRWLADRPRQVYPRQILRVPHAGIMPLSRRIYWVEADTRAALVQARLAGVNRIDVTTRWARRITLYLHDRLVDLDRPVEIDINGIRAFNAKLDRSALLALEQVRLLDDPGRIYAAAVTLDVPRGEASVEAGRRLWRSLAERQPPGRLSFWEMYATRALEERFPTIGLQGEETNIPLGPSANEAVGIHLTDVTRNSPFAQAGVRRGDILLEVGGEPFFSGRGGLQGLHEWLMRELTGVPTPYNVVVLRDGKRLELKASLSLGPYRDSTTWHRRPAGLL